MTFHPKCVGKKMSLFMVLITCLIIIPAGTTSVQAQYLACEDPNCTEPWQSSSRNIEVPGFPGCFVDVYFNFRVCNGITEVQVNYINLFGADTYCSDFFDCLCPFGLFGGMDEDCARQAWKEIYRQLTLVLFQEAYDALPPGFKHVLQCPNGSKQYEGFDGACTAMCVSYLLGNPSNSEDDHWTLRFNHCSTTCCVISRVICYNPVTDEIEVDETTEERGPVTNDCETITPPAPSCPDGFINWQGPCVPNCDTE